MVSAVSKAVIALFVLAWTSWFIHLFLRRQKRRGLDRVWFLTVAGLISYTVASTTDVYDEFHLVNGSVQIFEAIAYVLAALLTGIGLILWAQKGDQLMRRLEAEADTDFLTGILNRRSLFCTLEARVRRATAANGGGEPFCVLLLDLDHFKQVNDTRGHARGDRVLIDFADGARRVIRPGDVIFRYGGDEFAVILGGVKGQGVDAVVGRLAGVAAALGEELGIPLGISSGVAVCPADGETPDSLLTAADRRLYEAKDRRLRVSGLDAVPSPSRAGRR